MGRLAGKTALAASTAMENAMTSFEGKVALVVGGASGIGAAIATGLERSGATVIVADIRQAALTLDVTSFEDWAAAIETVEARYGGLDLMVNTAGGGPTATIDDMSPDHFEAMLRLNLTGAFFGIKACFPAMRRRGGGAIVNFASTLAVMASPTMIAYGAAKAGVIQAGRVAAIEGAPDNIRVNTVLPGCTRTPLTEEWLKSKDFVRIMVDPVPLRRAGEADEVAAAALFLLSDAASYISGTEITVDGGKMAAY